MVRLKVIDLRCKDLLGRGFWRRVRLNLRKKLVLVFLRDELFVARHLGV